MIMDQFEKVEKLREKANVSYEEAKQALEANNWDILDAMVYLEKLGKVHGPEVASYSTNNESNSNTESFTSTNTTNDTNFGDIFNRFFKWCGKILKKGNENFFQIERQNEKPINIPITFFVLAVFIFWFTFPLLILGLFFGLKYSFKGPDVDRRTVNDFMDRASETAENIKDDFKSGYKKD